MKKLIVILFSLVFFIQCEDNLREEGSYFIFGKYNGFCMDLCSLLYKYEDGKLYEDDMNTVQDEQNLIFKENPKSSVDINKVEKLFNDLPDDLLNSDKTSYGCPGCVDQDIILVQYYDGKELLSWRLDSFTDNMPENIANYTKRVINLLDQI